MIGGRFPSRKDNRWHVRDRRQVSTREVAAVPPRQRPCGRLSPPNLTRPRRRTAHSAPRAGKGNQPERTVGIARTLWESPAERQPDGWSTASGIHGSPRSDPLLISAMPSSISPASSSIPIVDRDPRRSSATILVNLRTGRCDPDDGGRDEHD